MAVLLQCEVNPLIDLIGHSLRVYLLFMNQVFQKKHLNVLDRQRERGCVCSWVKCDGVRDKPNPGLTPRATIKEDRDVLARLMKDHTLSFPSQSFSLLSHYEKHYSILEK